MKLSEIEKNMIIAYRKASQSDKDVIKRFFFICLSAEIEKIKINNVLSDRFKVIEGGK